MSALPPHIKFIACGAAAMLISFGNAMRTVPKPTPETLWLRCFLCIGVLSTVLVFRYFSRLDANVRAAR